MFKNLRLKIIEKIIKKLFFLYFYFRYTKNYNLDLYIKKQEEKFSNFNLNRFNGKKKFDDLKKSFTFLNSEMNSEHQTIFCSLSEKKNISITKILEIGTHDGKNAFLLSKLFPNALIETMDLEDDNEIFNETYSRNDKKFKEKFIDERNKILLKYKNIKFIQKNSLSLLFENHKKYNLIWIDGSHSYPVVTIDIVNALNLIDDGGVILCDDIFTQSIGENNIYRSNAGYETLTELKNANIISFTLFYKRLNKSFNAIPKERKFIAYITKNKF